MGEDAPIHVRSLVGPFARWLVAASISWLPWQAGRRTTHGTVAVGRMTATEVGQLLMAVGRMAAAAVVGQLMVETGCTAAWRPQRAGVYIPARGPRHPNSWLAGRKNKLLAGRNNSWMANRSNHFHNSIH